MKISASQLISNMICMNYDHIKKFGLFKFHSGYGKFYFNSPKGYNQKIINAQTDNDCVLMIVTNLYPQQNRNCIRLS